VLRDGQIVQYAAPEDLYSRPADPALARFVGDANLLNGQLSPPQAGTRMVDTILGRLPLDDTSRVLPEPGPVTVLIRPEQLEISEGQPGGGQDELAGRVVACEYYGHDAVIRVQPDGEPDGQHVIVRTAGGPQLLAGMPVTVRARGRVLAWQRGSA
jgi:iron(III) transport system ATP-binding protein